MTVITGSGVLNCEISVEKKNSFVSTYLGSWLRPPQ